MRIASIIGFIIFIVPTIGLASFTFPKNLSSTDRQETLKILGLGTAPKFLSNAYPLGGYNGLEISASVETFGIQRVSQLGDGAENNQDIYLPKITVGKGLYNKADIFFEFVPYSESSKTSRYGLQLRWSPYQAQFFPLNISFLIHANSANLSNELITRTAGADLIIGTMFDDFSLFFGGGWARTAGDFTGGSSGVTDSLNLERENVESGHLTVGAGYQWDILFFGLAYDRYQESVVTFKFGFLL